MLQDTLESTNNQLTSAHDALAVSEVSAANAKSPNPELQSQLTKLEKDLTSAQQTILDSKTALTKAQEDANTTLESISKMNDLELASKEEDHIQALSSLKKELASSKLAHSNAMNELLNKSASTPATTTSLQTDDIANLHAAHQSKLADVESQAREKISDLEMVSLFRLFV